MKELGRLFFGRTAKNSFITVGANIIHGLLMIVFFAIVSRALGPEKFGLVSIAFAVLAVSFDVLSLGTSQSLIRFVSVSIGKNQLKAAQQFASAIFRFRVIETIAVIFLATFAGRFLSLSVFSDPQLIAPLTITIAAVGGLLLIDFFITLLQAYEKFITSVLFLLAIAVVRLMLVALVVTFSQLTILTVSGAFVLAPVIISIIALLTIKNNFTFTSPSRAIITRLFHFSKWMALWGATAALTGRIDILLLGKLTSAYETGIYSAAARIATGFIIIGSSFASVLVPKISRLIDDRDELRRQFKLIWKVVAILVLGMILVAFISKWLIPIIFGTEYIKSILIFQGLTFALIFFMASIPANVSLLALGHGKWIGFLSLIQLIIVLAAGWVFIPQGGAFGAVQALTISYIVAFFLSTTYAFKKIYA